MELIQIYAKIDLNHADELAQRLTSHDDVFEAAQLIQKTKPDFDHQKLLLHFGKSLQLLTAEAGKERKFAIPFLDVNSSLDLAKAFHRLKDEKSKTIALGLALIFKQKCNGSLSQIRALCEIAKVCHKIGNQDHYTRSVEEAKKLCSDVLSKSDLVHAHLTFAHLFLSTHEYAKMDEELKEIQEAFQAADSYVRAEKCGELVVIMNKIQTTETVSSEFKNFSVEPLIKAVSDSLPSALSATTADRRAKAYLDVAGAYSELGKDNEAKQTLRLALDQIKTLPENTEEEIKTKDDLLRKATVFYKKHSDEVCETLQLLNNLYDKIPSFESLKKETIALTIIHTYNEMGRKHESMLFFNKYLSDKKNQKKEVESQIIYLMSDYPCFLPEQRKALLEAAEALLPKVSSSTYADMTSRIAEGYLKVDRQKSLELLKKYETTMKMTRATHHFALAAFSAFTAGITYFYPQTRIFLSVGVGALQLFV